MRPVYLGLVLLLSSCRPGVWEDVIGLSTRTVEVGSEDTTVTVQSRGGFQLMSLYVSDESGALVPADENAGRCLDGTEWYLSGDWIEVRRTTDQLSMKISVSHNDTGKTREAQICVALGDYADYVNVTQSY